MFVQEKWFMSNGAYLSDTEGPPVPVRAIVNLLFPTISPEPAPGFCRSLLHKQAQVLAAPYENMAMFLPLGY